MRSYNFKNSAFFALIPIFVQILQDIMPTTTYSKSSKFLLVIFASLCIMGGAAAMALPPAGDKDTPNMEKEAAIKVDPSAVANISEDQDTTMATETKLPTNKVS